MSSEEFRDHLKKGYREFVCQRCERRGCKLDLGSFDARDLIVIDCDKYKASKSVKNKISDFIMFCVEGEPVLVIAEVKGGGTDAEKAHKQILSTTEIAGEMAGTQAMASFFPIILHDRHKRMSNSDLKILKYRKVAFQGEEQLIDVWPCGTKLRTIIGGQEHFL